MLTWFHLFAITRKMPLRTIRVAFVLLLFVTCLASADNLLVSPSTAKASNRTLTFAERVAYQRAIEDVYWRHRIWPKENASPKPPLDAVISRAALEKKVRDYLCKSQALEDYWQRPITAEQLQAEMDRMASSTKQPAVLREIFAALGNDPFVIAECLARPALAERLLSNWYAYDQRIHGELKQRTEAELRVHNTVGQMTQAGGTYSEIELVRSDGGGPKNVGNAEGRTKLTSREWDATLQKLAAMFSKNSAAEAHEIIPIGRLSPLQEDEMRFYATAVIEKREDRVKVATVTWLKESLESWINNAENQTPSATMTPSAAYILPPISDQTDGCDDTWVSTAVQGEGRVLHTAVWTGSEMIVWGGEVGLSAFSNTGGRYTPSTDSWAATSTVNAPSGRAHHTAVWTGTEMILWGGDIPGAYVDTGGRYNPGTDSWTSTNIANAPRERINHMAIWTGSEMIVWGGLFYDPDNTPHYVNTGGRYNPNTDSWTATSITNAPDGRDSHTAIWTGNEMIVWGGEIANSQWVNTGGRYNVATDSWAATSTINVPSARASHTAVWTGSEMIVWGGYTFSSQTNTGGRYNPGVNTWTATNTGDAPSTRYAHTAVWTGSEMIVWGGYAPFQNSGASYKPNTDGWTPTNLTNAPPARSSHTAIWTGSEMIIWGGFFFDGLHDHYLNTGGRYCAEPSTPVVQKAVSRKTQGNVGTFDVDLPLSGTPGVECRSGGAANDYAIVLTFLANVSVNGNPQAAVSSGIGKIGSAGVSNGGMVTISGNVVTIPLTNVGNAQAINVTLNNVNGSSNVMIPMRVLIGDVNGNGTVNATDVAQTKLCVGQAVNAADFRCDVNAGGAINATDVSAVKSLSGTALPRVLLDLER
jgi:dockerin type I repeat protein